MSETVHNPDRYVSDLRQILSHGVKRIGFLFGAGVPFAIRSTEGKLDESGEPLIPNIALLTQRVRDGLGETDVATFDRLSNELGEQVTIEDVLSRVRLLSQAIGRSDVEGLDADGYRSLANNICDLIGGQVDVSLPEGDVPLMRVASWIGGLSRAHPIEIFTTNYDLLVEEALEAHKVPYFDGFVGSHQPFFDAGTVAENDLPSRWARLWKMHGSLGWDLVDGKVIRKQDRSATNLIFPDHLKYDSIQKLPYTSLFDRLKSFLRSSDTLLVCCGFSFVDSHICAVIEEGLASNPGSTVIAFQFGTLETEQNALKVATRNSNFSVYASDGACIGTSVGKWQIGDLPSPEWTNIRSTFWGPRAEGESPSFTLGDFNRFASFLTHVQADRLATSVPEATVDEH